MVGLRLGVAIHCRPCIYRYKDKEVLSSISFILSGGCVSDFKVSWWLEFLKLAFTILAISSSVLNKYNTCKLPFDVLEFHVKEFELLYFSDGAKINTCGV